MNYSPELIIGAVCETTNFSRHELLGPERYAELIDARFALYWLLYSDYKPSLQAVARITGRHHTTVMDVVAKFKRGEGDAHQLDIARKARRRYTDKVNPVYGIRRVLSA